MANPRPLVLALLLTVLTASGCSSSSKSTPSAATTPSASSSASSSPTAAPSDTVAPVGGGSNADFCTALKHYRASLQAESPVEEGTQLQAASAELRTYAPTAIKDAANLMADVLDQVGRDVAAGKPKPELIGQGQDAAHRQGLADTFAWQTQNCGT